MSIVHRQVKRDSDNVPVVPTTYVCGALFTKFGEHEWVHEKPQKWGTPCLDCWWMNDRGVWEKKEIAPPPPKTPSKPPRSYANMHWPGLYSVILSGDRPGNLRRMYVARPGHLHKDLKHARATFLFHQHAYDFKSTTVAGVVENLVYTTKVSTELGEPFHQYKFESAMEGKLSLEHAGTIDMKRVRHEVCKKGQSYELGHGSIHRVVFHADPDTGWFACLIEETKAHPRPEFCWSREYLHDIPYKDELYVPMSRMQVATLLDDMEASGIVIP